MAKKIVYNKNSGSVINGKSTRRKNRGEKPF